MKRLSVILASILIIILVLGILNVLKEAAFPKTTYNEASRVHMNTGNTTRINVNSSDNLSIEISNVLYPATDEDSKPLGLILVQAEDWKDVIALIPLMRTYKNPIIPIGRELGQDILYSIRKLSPKGIPELENTQIMMFGHDIESLQNSLVNLDYKINYSVYGDLEELQTIVYSFPKVLGKEEYGFIVSDRDAFTSIPIATWIANNQGILMSAGEDGHLYETSI